MKELDHYCRIWSLSEVEKVAETFTSHVYRATCEGEPVALKVLNSVGQEDEGRAPHALQWFEGQGSVRLLQYDDGAHLLEFIEGPNLATLVDEGKDSESTSIIADTLNSMHGRVQVPGMNLPTLRERFFSLYAMAQQQVNVSSPSTYSTAVRIADRLFASEQDRRVLHGDLHHENILFSGTRGWLAIDPKGLYGDRTYDAANALFNPLNSPELVANENRLLRTAGILAERMELDFNRLLAFAFTHGCLSACWSIEDGQDPGMALRVVRILEKHVA